MLPLYLCVLLSSPQDPERVLPGVAELPGGNSQVFRARTADPEPAPEVPAKVERRAVSRIRAALPRLSSRFGRRGDPFRNLAAMHYGVDMPGRIGTPVLASASGVVRFAGSAGSYGQMVEIDHDGALATRYAHLSRILVRAGTPVERGQMVALMGSTGRSTGSHLHFEVRIAGRPVDPLRWLGAAGADSTAPSTPAPASAWITPAAPHISAFAKARAAEPWARAF